MSILLSRRIVSRFRAAGLTKLSHESLIHATIKSSSISNQYSSCRISQDVKANDNAVTTDSDESRKVESESENKWDYDILINGGGIVGVTFAAKILQKTSNTLKIGIGSCK
jgi:NADH dehydrogenase FAD-containing subunit